MDIKVGNRYQIEGSSGTVDYHEASVGSSNRLFEGEQVYRIDNRVYTRDGRLLRLNLSTRVYEVDSDPLYSVHEVDEDRLYRRTAKGYIFGIAREFEAVRSGKNNDPFDCGTASDEIIAQAGRVCAEMTRLRQLLEATHMDK